MSREWTAVKVKVKPSTIHGYGAFTIERIGEHQLIATTHGAWIWPADIKTAPSERWRYWLSHYAYSHHNEWVFLRGPMKFVNHSCAPNIVWVNECCFALRNIAAGEELFENYRDFMLGRFHLFGNKCRCPACSGKLNHEKNKRRADGSGKQRALGAAR